MHWILFICFIAYLMGGQYKDVPEPNYKKNRFIQLDEDAIVQSFSGGLLKYSEQRKTKKIPKQKVQNVENVEENQGE